MKKLRNSVVIIGSNKYLLDLLNLGVFIILFYHTIGSIFFGIGKLEIKYLNKNIEETWRKRG